MTVLALGVVGSALGSAIGIGASAGWLGGVLLGNLLFGGAKGQNIEGPRIDDLLGADLHLRRAYPAGLWHHADFRQRYLVAAPQRNTYR